MFAEPIPSRSHAGTELVTRWYAHCPRSTSDRHGFRVTHGPMGAHTMARSAATAELFDRTGPCVLPAGLAVSVIIPARDEAPRIGKVVRAVLAQESPAGFVEVIVVDDGSSDATAKVARHAGARVVRRLDSAGNPGAARNAGACVARGGLLVFLDADCTPAPGWLQALLDAHDRGAVAVGGAIEAAPEQGAASRCNHYCGFYHVHPLRRRGVVPNHPPANLSIRRAEFFAAGGFSETMPIADGHEELVWQDRLKSAGHGIQFEPTAIVLHRYRPGWLQLLKRNYRWAYSALRSKRGSRAVRFSWIYRSPILLMLAAPLLALVHAGYTILCWVRVGVLEPLVMLPAVLAARIAYAAGLVVGGIRWLVNPLEEVRPLGGRWR